MAASIYAALSQFFVNVIGIVRDAAVGVRDTFPGGGTDQPVFEGEIVYFYGFKYLFQNNSLLYKSVWQYYNELQRKNKKAEFSLPL